MNYTAVALENITIDYTDRWRAKKNPVLNNINFHVNAGDTVLVRGANGSGKSTLLKTILGLVRILSGTRKIYCKEIGYVPQLCVVPGWMTARQFLYYKVGVTHSSLTEIDRTLELVNLLPAKNDKLATFSQGMVQRVLIAQACVGNPELMILDEPFANVDTEHRKSIVQRIIYEKNPQQTVVITDHDFTAKNCNVSYWDCPARTGG